MVSHKDGKSSVPLRAAPRAQHHAQHHARWRTIWFCPVPGCPVSTPNKEGLVQHLQSKQHAKGVNTFRIPSSHMDVGFIDACAAFLTPKMSLSQVRPSGATLCRAAIEPTPTSALTERPSASTYREDDSIAKATTMSADLVTPMFQPL